MDKLGARDCWRFYLGVFDCCEERMRAQWFLACVILFVVVVVVNIFVFLFISSCDRVVWCVISKGNRSIDRSIDTDMHASIDMTNPGFAH